MPYSNTSHPDFLQQSNKDLFQEEKGYDWTPGLNLTWDQYYEIGSWINDKVADGTITEVEYGIGHQAKQANSLSCDFTNVLAVFGGSYFGTAGVVFTGYNSDTSLVNDIAIVNNKITPLSICRPGGGGGRGGGGASPIP